jgi:ABC-2 type transport system permease protein
MIGVIASHELQLYRRSAFAWVAAAALQLVLGWLFLSATEQYTLLQNTAAHTSASGLTSHLVVHFIAPASIVMMLATPLLCMNLIALEKQTGRYDLFASAPVEVREIVLGKFIAAMVFQLIILLLSAALVSSLLLFVPLDIGHLISAYVGLALFVALATSVTLLFSSLTKIPALAAFLSFTCLLLAWMAATADGTGMLSSLSPSVRVQRFMQGIFHTGDLMYFICLSAVLLVLCSWRTGAVNHYPEVKP